MAKDKSHKTSSSNLEKNSSRAENYRGDAGKGSSNTKKDLYKNLKSKK